MIGRFLRFECNEDTEKSMKCKRFSQQNIIIIDVFISCYGANGNHINSIQLNWVHNLLIFSGDFRFDINEWVRFIMRSIFTIHNNETKMQHFSWKSWKNDVALSKISLEVVTLQLNVWFCSIYARHCRNNLNILVTAWKHTLNLLDFIQYKVGQTCSTSHSKFIAINERTLTAVNSCSLTVQP